MCVDGAARAGRKSLAALVAGVAVLAAAACQIDAPLGGGGASDADGRPNIVLIVADDLGYADIGALGGEIATPNLDRLAEEGTLFTRFYTSFTCSPTRAMLMSGVDNHLAGLGNMEETTDPAQQGKPGYEGYLNSSVASMAEIFSAAGYQTYMSGKWHLGREHDQSAHARGFAKTFMLIGGGGSHFADRIGQDPFRAVAYYRENGELIDDLPDDFFSSDFYTDKLIEFITDGEDGAPFLAYLAFTAPHWPLQAHEQDMVRQRGAYAEGYDVIRTRRFEALKAAGLIPEDMAEPEGTAPAWDALSDEERAHSERRMEVYAAMVANMDDNIGKLTDYLSETGHLENTVIVFLSDNGADGLEAASLSPAMFEWTETFDNRLENVGLINSFVTYGPGWAHAGEAPHAGFKGLSTEGGLRSPMIMALPDGLGGAGGRYEHAVTVRDVLPTLMDLAGVPDHGEDFDGREVHAISGTSLRAALNDVEAPVHADTPLGFELWDRRALIRGDWKIHAQSAPVGDGEWRLFNLSEDVAESVDRSREHPEIFQQLLADYADYAAANNVIEPSEPIGLRPPESDGPAR